MKQFNNLTIQQSVLEVIRYFSFFNYPPTFGEIYTFLNKKASKRRIMAILKTMQKKSTVKACKIDDREWRIEDEVLKMEVGRSSKKQNLYLPSTFYHLSSSVNTRRYTLPEYSIYTMSSRALRQAQGKLKSRDLKKSDLSLITNYELRITNSIKKLNNWQFRFFIRILSFSPQISLIGLSGSVAMLNADKDHDVDLFIITSKKRLYTGRFIALLLAQLLGIRRHRHSGKRLSEREGARPESLFRFWSCFAPQKDNNLTIQPRQTRLTQFSNFSRDKVCLNLFLEESDLSVPKFKRSDYVAHEILQMKPLFIRGDIYRRFLDANRWVFDIFPNAPLVIPTLSERSESKGRNLAKRKLRFFDILFLIFNFIQDWIEAILKKFQLHSINKHRTSKSEIITATQLWFHPIDFSKKIKL